MLSTESDENEVENTVNDSIECRTVEPGDGDSPYRRCIHTVYEERLGTYLKM